MSKDKAAQLLDIGAEFVGGVAFLDHKEVGRWQDGEFYPELGTEELVAQHTKRASDARAQVRENARLAAEAQKPTGKVGKETKVAVPEKPATISAEEAATTQNSIPGSGPRNPVRADGDNNRTPEVTEDTTPQSAEDVLTALDNLDGAKAAAGKTK